MSAASSAMAKGVLQRPGASSNSMPRVASTVQSSSAPLSSAPTTAHSHAVRNATVAQRKSPARIVQPSSTPTTAHPHAIHGATAAERSSFAGTIQRSNVPTPVVTSGVLGGQDTGSPVVAPVQSRLGGNAGLSGSAFGAVQRTAANGTKPVTRKVSRAVDSGSISLADRSAAETLQRSAVTYSSGETRAGQPAGGSALDVPAFSPQPLHVESPISAGSEQGGVISRVDSVRADVLQRVGMHSMIARRSAESHPATATQAPLPTVQRTTKEGQSADFTPTTFVHSHPVSPTTTPATGSTPLQRTRAQSVTVSQPTHIVSPHAGAAQNGQSALHAQVAKQTTPVADLTQNETTSVSSHAALDAAESTTSSSPIMRQAITMPQPHPATSYASGETTHEPAAAIELPNAATPAFENGSWPAPVAQATQATASSIQRTAGQAVRVAAAAIQRSESGGARALSSRRAVENGQGGVVSAESTAPASAPPPISPDTHAVPLQRTPVEAVQREQTQSATSAPPQAASNLVDNRQPVAPYQPTHQQSGSGGIAAAIQRAETAPHRVGGRRGVFHTESREFDRLSRVMRRHKEVIDANGGVMPRLQKTPPSPEVQRKERARKEAEFSLRWSKMSQKEKRARVQRKLAAREKRVQRQRGRGSTGHTTGTQAQGSASAEFSASEQINATPPTAIQRMQQSPTTTASPLQAAGETGSQVAQRAVQTPAGRPESTTIVDRVLHPEAAPATAPAETPVRQSINSMAADFVQRAARPDAPARSGANHSAVAIDSTTVARQLETQSASSTSTGITAPIQTALTDASTQSTERPAPVEAGTAIDSRPVSVQRKARQQNIAATPWNGEGSSREPVQMSAQQSIGDVSQIVTDAVAATGTGAVQRVPQHASVPVQRQAQNGVSESKAPSANATPHSALSVSPGFGRTETTSPADRSAHAPAGTAAVPKTAQNSAVQRTAAHAPTPMVGGGRGRAGNHFSTENDARQAVQRMAANASTPAVSVDGGVASSHFSAENGARQAIQNAMTGVGAVTGNAQQSAVQRTATQASTTMMSRERGMANGHFSAENDARQAVQHALTGAASITNGVQQSAVQRTATQASAPMMSRERGMANGHFSAENDARQAVQQTQREAHRAESGTQQVASVEAIARKIAPERASRSSVQFVPPRGPRPGRLQRRHNAKADVTRTQQPEPGLSVETEVGNLPGDLWAVMDQPIPNDAVVARTTATPTQQRQQMMIQRAIVAAERVENRPKSSDAKAFSPTSATLQRRQLTTAREGAVLTVEQTTRSQSLDDAQTLHSDMPVISHLPKQAGIQRGTAPVKETDKVAAQSAPPDEQNASPVNSLENESRTHTLQDETVENEEAQKKTLLTVSEGS